MASLSLAEKSQESGVTEDHFEEGWRICLRCALGSTIWEKKIVKLGTVRVRRLLLYPTVTFLQTPALCRMARQWRALHMFVSIY
jgi:hypothetical protein